MKTHLSMNLFTRKTAVIIPFVITALFNCTKQDSSTGEALEIDRGEKLVLSFEGPQASEQDSINPFAAYRLNAVFKHGEHGELVIPGFYSADGNSAESGAESGNVWQVIFRPPFSGEWHYQISFEKGKNIAVNPTVPGESVAPDGREGVIRVLKDTDDYFGRLQYHESGYPKFVGKDLFFLKNGAGSPENLLAYHEFDGTYRQLKKVANTDQSNKTTQLHTYQAHIQDWKTGDPTWQQGKGKGIIGGINYLASKGVNSIYFLTMNIQGDGEDVWPYTSYEERTRFDCSKLAQWEIVFDHIESLGMLLHFITQETENELLLDGGDLGVERKLYYRELIARFGHHTRLIWNMGEENGWAKFTPKAQTDAQRLDMLQYFKEVDPYNNLTAIHSHHYKPERDTVFVPLLGHKNLDVLSSQVSFPHQVYEVTTEWGRRSEENGKKWIVFVDEIGPAKRGVDPDSRTVDNNQSANRKQKIWGNLMAGGAGTEAYFGFENPHNDLEMEDWRSRDNYWSYGKLAVDFFQQYLPFTEMAPHNELISGPPSYCFAKPGEIYAIYLPEGEESSIVLESDDRFEIFWYNPRYAEELLQTDIKIIKGQGTHALGLPPKEIDQDWAILVRKI